MHRSRLARSVSPASGPAVALVLAVLCAPAAAQESRAHFDTAQLHYWTGVHSLADLDGDGNLDGFGFVYSNWPSSATVEGVRGQGDGTFSGNLFSLSRPIDAFQGDPFRWSMDTGHFDAGGQADIMFSFNTDVEVFTTGVGGALTEYWTRPAGDDLEVRSALVLDVDGNGLDDLVFAGTDDVLDVNGMQLWLNSGTGFDLADTHDDGYQLTLADVDGQPGPEVVARSGSMLQVLSLAGNALTVVSTLTHPFEEDDVVRVAAADIDGDGDDDLVVFAVKPHWYVVYRQTAPGVLEAEAITSGGPGVHHPASDAEPPEVAFADIDGDGDLDALSCGASPTVAGGGGTFTVSLNDGTGVFAPAWSIRGYNARRLAGAVDIDGDGDLDLVGGHAVYFNPGAGGAWSAGVEPQPQSPTFTPSASDPWPSVGDRDGDGDLDIWFRKLDPFYISPYSSDDYWVNDGTGALTPKPTVLPPPPAGTQWDDPSYFADFDGDGDIDRIVQQEDTLGGFLDMRLFTNTGGGDFVDGGSAVPAGVPLGGAGHVAADLDGDGDVDLVVEDLVPPGFDIWRNDGSGSFTKSQGTVVGVEPIATADLDGDGRPDIIDREMLITFSTGGAYAPTLDLLTFPSWDSPAEGEIAIRDIDGNGHLDIVAATYYHGLVVWWNEGSSTFTREILSGFSKYSNPHLLDVDGDGFLDIVVDGRPNYYQMYVLFGDGARGFPTTVIYCADLWCLADLDGDGDEDVYAHIPSGDALIRNTRFPTPDSGFRKQIGKQSAGFGGMAPTLGITGPLRVGEFPKLRVVGARGAAPLIMFLAGPAAVTPDWPVPGLEGYVADFLLANLYFLDGDDAVPGSGSLEFTLPISPVFAGVSVTVQAFIQDPSLPYWLAQTNGLRLHFGD